MSHPHSRRGPLQAAQRGLRCWGVLLLVYLSSACAALAAPPVDPLEALLRGEFALQEGRTAEAAGQYAEAALASNDPELLERATRLALMDDDLATAGRLLQRWLQLDPQAASAQQVALVIALREVDQPSGERALRRLVKQPDGWKLALQALAGDSTSLLVPALLAQLIDADPVRASLEALLSAGGLADRLGLDGLREQVGTTAIRQHPERARGWLWHAEVKRKKGDNPAARQAIDRALALPDMDPSLRLAAAGMLAALGEPQAAAAALAAGEQAEATWAGRASFLSRAEDFAGLLALYEEVQAAGGERTPDRLHLLGQLAELLERKDEALAWYRLLPPGPRADQAQLRIAILADAAAQHETAIGVLRELQQRETDDGQLLIDAYLLEAQLLQRHGRHLQAVEAYSRGLAVFEDEPALLYGRALAHERLGQIDEAEADLRLMLVLDPENPEALNALGYTLADRTQRFAEAYELIRQALEINPDNPAIIDSMGWVLFRMGRIDEALPHLRRAFEMQRDAEVAAHLGEALWAAGDQDEARSIWRLGLELDANNEALQRSLKQHGVEP